LMSPSRFFLSMMAELAALAVVLAPTEGKKRPAEELEEGMKLWVGLQEMLEAHSIPLLSASSVFSGGKLNVFIKSSHIFICNKMKN
jgi:hypothetical protein